MFRLFLFNACVGTGSIRVTAYFAVKFTDYTWKSICADIFNCAFNVPLSLKYDAQ